MRAVRRLAWHGCLRAHLAPRVRLESGYRPFTLSCRMRPCRFIVAALILLLLALAGCAGLPEDTRAVQDFSAERYLGRWYEIARLDHGFEQGLDCVTATYSSRADGGLRVVNRGVNLDAGEPSEAVGKAYFTGPESEARLKVSFFGPFYGGYNVLAIDEAYETALVAGSNRDYLWLLARSPTISDAERARFVNRAKALDFPTDALITVGQGTACEAFREAAPASA